MDQKPQPPFVPAPRHDAAAIENLFTYHAPKGDQPARYIKIRDKAKELALLIVESCPASQERSKAITDLRQAVQWANASIAINE
jgi:hypothetical protein